MVYFFKKKAAHFERNKEISLSTLLMGGLYENTHQGRLISTPEASSNTSLSFMGKAHQKYIFNVYPVYWQLRYKSVWEHEAKHKH